MKEPEDTRKRARTWLDNKLADLVAEGGARGLAVKLDAPTGMALRDQWPAARDWAFRWREAAHDLPRGATLEWAPRMLGAARQDLPDRLVLPTAGAAAEWAAGTYPDMLSTAHERWKTLLAVFPDTSNSAVLRAVMGWEQVDVDLLVSTALWFAANPMPDGAWTPRQVPVPGLHAKWLDVTGRRTLIEKLAGIPALRLRSRPVQARITYIDPGHVAAGQRKWDIITAGDTLALPYPVDTVLIVENRDTAFYFPPEVPGGVVVLGNGDAAVSLATTARPLMATTRVLYWGDIDAEGLRIVSRLRASGHPVTSILMDLPTYDTYADYGTSRDQHGRIIPCGDPIPPPGLTPDEKTLYCRLTDPDWAGHRRIEQERIPLDVAVETVAKTVQDESS